MDIRNKREAITKAIHETVIGIVVFATLTGQLKIILVKWRRAIIIKSREVIAKSVLLFI